MAGMTRNNSAASLQGFSVCQPAVGAALQFLPALGTPELDTLIDAFLPGPASIKDKRATVCMDFCEFARRTGETLKFYPVYAAAESPASTMYDSGYGSNFDVSPVVSDLTWSRTGSFAGPSAAAPKRKASMASTRAPTNDFSHLPGMKIMTKDGMDVTNSASRGCKTKEQRDHAHLMRIIKACDACRRKKIRCDPAHRKRSAQSPPESKPARKAKKVASEARTATPAAQPDLLAGNAPFYWDETAAVQPLDQVLGLADESWEQFLQYDDENLLPVGYDFFADPQGYFSPSSGSSASPAQPFTPAPPGPSAVDAYAGSLFPELDSQEAVLPYLNSGSHGTNYIDFSLYSPASSFIDEEPLMIQTKARTTQQEQSCGSSPSSLSRPGASNSSVSAGGLESWPVSSPHDENHFHGSPNEQRPPQTVRHPAGEQRGSAALQERDPWNPQNNLVVATTFQSTVSPQSGYESALMNLQAARGSGGNRGGHGGTVASPVEIAQTVTGTASVGFSRNLVLRSFADVSQPPTFTSTTDATTQPMSTVVGPPPVLQQVRRCGKDGLASATMSPSSPLSTAPSSGPLRASSMSTNRGRQPQNIPLTATSTSEAAGVPSMASLWPDVSPNNQLVYVRGLSGRSRSPQQQWPAVTHQISAARSGVDSHGLVTERVLLSGTDAVWLGSLSYVLVTATLIAAVLPLTLPIRQIVDVIIRSNSFRFLLALVVGLGLASLVSTHIPQSLSSDILNKLPTVALSLAPVAIRHCSSSQSVPASAENPSTALQDTIDNVKSKIQETSAAVRNLRCVLSRRLRPATLKGSPHRAFSR